MNEQQTNDPNVARRMELARKSLRKGKWTNEEDHKEYQKLVMESLVLSQKKKPSFAKQRGQALKDMGLTKVKGRVSGRTYWE